MVANRALRQNLAKRRRSRSKRLRFTDLCRIATIGGIMESFKASAQYLDWEGTAAAEHHQSSLRNWLADKGLIHETSEFLIAVTLYVSEHHYTSLYVRALVFRSEQSFELLKDALAAIEGPIPVREVKAELTTEEFLAFSSASM